MPKKTQTAITKSEKEGVLQVTPETVKKYINRHATEQEIVLFLNQCKMFDLNPFKREIHLIKYSDRDPATFVVGYDVYLKRANRSKLWAGMESGIKGTGNNMIAWVKVYRKDWAQPLYHEVDFEEYAKYKKDGELTRFWKEKPKTMLKKVAISQAFRMAFPEDFAGMPYTVEEINSVDPQRLPDALDSYTEETEETEEKEAKAKEHEEKTKDDPAHISQTTEINQLESTLIDKYGYPPDTLLEEVEKRLGIADMNELTKEQADKVIEFYRKTLNFADEKAQKENRKAGNGELFET